MAILTYDYTPTSQEFQDYLTFVLDREDGSSASLNPLLINTGHRIMASLQSSGQADCVWPPWAVAYLRELNIIIAAVMFNQSSIRLSNEQRELYSDYAQEQLQLLRESRMVVCSGVTGIDFPAWASVQYNLTPRNTAKVDYYNTS